jgi:two-component system, response regulator YesN
MRIMIADDEFLVRSSLKSILGEFDTVIDSVDEATNGSEMASIVGQYQPDIAFVDICMPGLNGLEAIRSVQASSPQTKWFILTGFPEFDYAQEAIRLGVSGYLLKPASPEELKKVVDDCVEEGKKQRMARNKQFESELMSLFYGLNSAEFEGPQSFVPRGNFIGSIIHFDSFLPEKERAERQFAFCRSVQLIVNENLDHYNRFALIVLPNGDLATIGAWDPNQSCQTQKHIQKYFKSLENEARNASTAMLTITITMTRECSSFQELQDQLDLLHEFGALRALTGIGKRLDIEALRQWSAIQAFREISSHVKSLCRSYRDKNHLNYTKAIQRLKNACEGDDFKGEDRLKKSLSDFLNRSIGCQLAADHGMKDWVRELAQHYEFLPAETVKEDVRHTDIIEQVIAFTDNNYMYNIGIGQIAEQLKITPNYLTTLFHRKTGIKFTAFLKQIRLQRARELLTNPAIQVQQVAEQVGYSSTRHFARLFSEYYGCLPSEFRDGFKDPGNRQLHPAIPLMNISQ